jgi:CubicO group peptidase (beta-lactamase class C family)
MVETIKKLAFHFRARGDNNSVIDPMAPVSHPGGYAQPMLMQGAPPPEHLRVTLANWQDPPYNRWAFSHLRELVPTQRISRGPGPVPPLVSEHRSLGEVPVRRVSGEEADVDHVLDDTYTDAVVVLHGGQVVLERYWGETEPETPHLVMSISKSIVGCVAGNLEAGGVLDTTQLVTDFVPELTDSGYADATVRDVLDMRSGVKFSEEYTDPEAEVRIIEQAMGWRPESRDEVRDGMYAYLTTLERSGEHGGVFNYRSCETDVLGWCCERAAGVRMADLISELVWAPMGAEFDAEITCDRIGTGIHDGGVCAAARDVARFGAMLLAGGQANDHHVVPATWLETAWMVGADIRGAFRRSASGPYLPGGWYRNQFWFVPRQHGDVLLCLGIHGQMVYVSRGTSTVAVKLSTWPDAQSPEMLHDTLRMFDAIGAALANLPIPNHDGLGLPTITPPGVATGSARYGPSQ